MTDAQKAAALFAIDPVGLGGIVLRASPGPLRDRWLSLLKSSLPEDVPIRRVPVHASDDRLLGGLDLTATLAAGRPIREQGLLATCDGGVLLLPMAERLPGATAALIAAALDSGEIRMERDGFTQRAPSRFGVIALDESLDDEERPSLLLRERLAFEVSVDGLSLRDWPRSAFDPAHIAEARQRLAEIDSDDDLIEALTGTALALGIASLRAPLFALKAALAAAALAGRRQVAAEDATIAVRLALVHRATRLPADAEDDDRPEPPEYEMAGDDDGEGGSDRPLEDRLLESAVAALPPQLLASLRQAGKRRGVAGRAGGTVKNGLRGRPVGARPGRPGGGQRLGVIETLRAAAPWQPLRQRSRPDWPASRVIVHADDLRIIRRKQQSRTTTVFAVDASGSSALERLAEAKGAVELLLAECYTRRDQVALLAFRGQGAELLLPPTRSLVRAKRSLGALPGGGGTPLAAGIDAVALLADGARRRGETPLLVFLTDGRANIARDGTPGRKQALAEALASAKRLAASGDAALVIDISLRPGAEAAALAEAMDARYLPLPKADARTLSDMVATARTA